MNTKGTNRSVARTQALLKQGLTELMKDTPVQKISVKQLTDYVNLNRGTFYLHYRDIRDLLEHIENDLMDEFIAINQSHDVKSLNGSPYPLLYDLFCYLEKNADFVRTLLTENQEQNFVNRIKEYLRERCLKEWTIIFTKSNPGIDQLYTSYVLAGCVGIIEDWICRTPRETPAELARRTEDIMMGGLNILK